MIFVTVGTHEQQFNRLIEYMDKWAESHEEEVILQTGYSTYHPEHCYFQNLFPYQEVKKMIQEARIVITHGGPSSFIMPLQVGKVPIVVPRNSIYGEHVNDHQIEFCRQVAKRQHNIILVESINELANTINNYSQIKANMTSDLNSNNKSFCKEFEKLVKMMFEKGKVSR